MARASFIYHPCRDIHDNYALSYSFITALPLDTRSFHGDASNKIENLFYQQFVISVHFSQSKKEGKESLTLSAYRHGNAVHDTSPVRSLLSIDRVSQSCAIPSYAEALLFDVSLKTTVDGSRVERQKSILKFVAVVAISSHFTLPSDLLGGSLGTGSLGTVY